MRLLTWNIHKGIGGTDRRYAPGRIVEVIRHYDPDVAVLQEVDRGVPRSRRDEQASLLAEALDMPHVAWGPTVRLKEGCYGNATLSRLPITGSHNINLTFPLKKARAALLTHLRVPTGEHHYAVHVLNVHLGLAGAERRWQVRKLLGTAHLQHLDRRSRIALVGDTNDWAGVLAAGRLAEHGFRCVTGTGRGALRTFPSWAPVGGLDKVFLRGPLACTRVLRPRLALARAASDHLPLVVDLRPGAAP